MTAKMLLDNFLASFKKPFSAEMMSEFTGVDIRKVRTYIKKAVKAGDVIGDKGIYVIRRNVWVCCNAWVYGRDAAKAVMRVIEKHHCRSVRQVADYIGYSRQYAFKYMEALASIDAIYWCDGSYHVNKDASLSRLGADIEKGVLRRIRKDERCRQM